MALLLRLIKRKHCLSSYRVLLSATGGGISGFSGRSDRKFFCTSSAMFEDGVDQRRYHKPLPGLPAIFTLDLTRKGVHVENLRSIDLVEAFQLVEDGASRGDNVGTDEFPTREDFEELVSSGTALCLRDTLTKHLRTIVVIQPCRFSRSVNPYLATVYVFTCAEFSHFLVWRDLARLAQRFVLDVELGYGACLTCIFFRCVERMQAFREEGFSITACIHEAGKLQGSNNYVASYVLHKDFQIGNIPKMTLNGVKKLADDVSSHASPHSPKTVPFFPVDYVMRDGTSVVMRNLQPSETDRFYQTYSRGFGHDECPTRQFFMERHIRQSYNCTVEERSSGKPIAVFSITPSEYSRSRSTHLLDGFIIVEREFVGKGYGTELYEVMGVVGLQLGFTGSHVDTAADNIASIALFLRNGAAMCGVIPKSIYFADRGWLDTVLFYQKYSSHRRYIKETSSAKV